MTNKRILTLISLLLFLFLLVGCKPNLPPEITSDPVTTAIVGVDYVYDVEATDPNNNILTYSLIDEPGGMLIDEDNGVITWTPTIDDVGDVDVTVEVSDGKLSDTQDFTITVGVVELDHIVVLPEAMALFVGESETITSVTAHYSDESTASIALGDCTYLSDDEAVATVLVGVVSGVEVGTATITVTYADMTDTLEVTVDSILLTSIVVDPKDMTLIGIGESEDIESVTAHYSDGSTKIVTSDCDYESNNEAVATVDAGEVTSVAYGEATITVSYTEEEITKVVLIEETDTLEVTVIDQVHNITSDRYYDEIQTAIADAWAGDTIEVAEGTYAEDLSIDRSVTLKSVTGDYRDSGVNIEGQITLSGSHDEITIQGFNFVVDDTVGAGEGLNIWSGAVMGDDFSILSNSFTASPATAVTEAAIGITCDSAPWTGLLIDDNLFVGVRGVWAAGQSSANNEVIITNNVVDGDPTTPAWTGISVQNVRGVISDNVIDSTWDAGINVGLGVNDMNISDNTVTHAVSADGAWGNAGAINLYSDCTDITITGNTLSDSYDGITIKDNEDAALGSGIAVNYNNITGNSNYGIFNDAASGTLDATNNWWGAASGPEHSTNPGGTGDEISDNVAYVPFSTEEN